MDEYLTEQEKLREKNLVAPHETSYPPLVKRTSDIHSFAELVKADEGATRAPPCC